MPEPRQFIDLTEVFYESVKVSEKPHTWWRNLMAATGYLYDYDAKYERQPRTKAVSVPVDSIAKIEECEYSGGVKAALIMKAGEPVYTKDDRATILKKMAPPSKPAQ